MEIVYDESLRTEDYPEHAVIVFEDKIGIYIIHKDWSKEQRYIHTEKFIGKKCDNTKENKSNTVLFYINSIILKEFEDIKRVLRSRKLMKNRQHNGQK